MEEEIIYGNEFEHPPEEHDAHSAMLEKERALNEAHGKVISGVATDADYALLRQISTESFKSNAPKFNPRFISQGVATENVAHLHNAIKVGIVLSLVALLAAIFKTFLGGSSEKGGGGGGKGANVAEKAKPLGGKPATVVEPVSQGLTGLQDKLTKVLKSAPKDVEEDKFIESCCKDLGTMYASQGKKPEDFATFAKKFYHVLVISRKFFGSSEDYEIPGYKEMLQLYNGRFACGQILANKGILTRHQFLRYAFLHNEAMNSPVMSNKEFADQVTNIDQHIEYHKELNDIGRGLLDAPDVTQTEAWRDLQKAFLSSETGEGVENHYFSKAEGKEFLDKLKAEFTILPVESIDLAKMQHVFSDKTMTDLEARYKRCDEINDGVNRAMRDCSPDGEMTRFIKEELQFKIDDLKKEIEEDGKDTAVGQTKVRWKTNIETYVKIYEGYLYTTKSLVLALTGLRNSTDKIAVGLVASFDEISTLGKVLMEFEAIVTKTFAGLASISNEGFRTVDGVTTDVPAVNEGVVGSDDTVILPAGFDIDALDQLDLTNMDHEELSETLHECDEQHQAMHEDEMALEQFCTQVRKTGRINKQIVRDVEAIQPGLITSKIPLGRFTSFESTTNANVSLESMEGLQKGLKIAAAVAGAALLVKMIMWIRSKYGMMTDTTKAITGKLAMAKSDMETAYKNIGEIESQKTQPSDETKEAINTKIKGLGVSESFDFGNPRNSFNKLRDTLLWAKCKPFWSEGTLELAQNGGTAKALQELGKMVDSSITLLSNTLTKLEKVVNESKGGDNVSVSVEPTPYDFKGVLSALGLSAGGTSSETIESILTEVKKRLTPLDDQGKFNIDVLSKFRESTPNLVKGMEGRATNEIEKIEKQSTEIQKEISAMPSDTKSSSLSAGSAVVKSDTKTLTDIVQSYNLILGAAKGLSAAFSDGAKELKDITEAYKKGGKAASK